MERLTTDNPKDNIENALNLFYAKDQWVWVRGGGPAPDYADISLCDFVRMLVKSNIPDATLPENDDDLSMMMEEWLMDEPDTAEGIIALLYTAGWAFAELRHRLAYYEDLKEQGRLVVLPPPAKDGDPKPKCFYTDNQSIWCLGMAPADGDEPVERCKQCWYCEAGYAREEAERALEGGSRNE